MTTTTATYEADLAAAEQMLLPRIAAAAATETAQFLSEQLGKSLKDALNNTWVEGLTIDQWVEMAIARVGISVTAETTPTASH